jgi:hypothetical protein
MFTIEKRAFRRPRLKEYVIRYGSDHTLDRKGTDICVLGTNPKNTSQMRMVQSDEDLILVICNLNGTIELIKLVPARNV